MKKLYFVVATFISLGMANLVIADTIEIYVPTPPGGAVDMTARSVSKSLTSQGYKNVVMYQPGANGDIALHKVLEKSKNSMLVASSANWVFSHLLANRENIHVKDLQLLGPSVSNAMAFYSPMDKTSDSFQDLIMRARNGNMTCAVSNSHGEIELKQINQRYGTKFVAVPYKGTGQLIPDLIGGHVPCAYDQIAPYTQLQGKVNFLATSGTKSFRNNIPLISSVLPGYSFVSWYAVGIPKTSALLEDKKLLAALNWTQDQELADPMVERSFVIEISDPNLNARAVRETTQYRNSLK
jgi:tripartite-type tricarboxylate transporter receptor subunit TctC